MLSVTGCAGTTAPGGPPPSAAPAPSLPEPSLPEPSLTPPSGSTAPPASVPASSAGPGKVKAELISVTKSGGIAGLTDSVTVWVDGSWTRTSKRSAERTGRLSGAQLTRLRTLADDPRLATEPTGGKPGTCADAFTYAVVTAGRRLTYEDCPGQSRPEATLALAGYVLDATKP